MSLMQGHFIYSLWFFKFVALIEHNKDVKYCDGWRIDESWWGIMLKLETTYLYNI